MKIKGVDLFCGCGGLSRGFEDAGIPIVEAYDFWPDAIACYRDNFSHSAKIVDISEVKEMSEQIATLAPNIIVGGPPCQDFSTAGNRTEGVRANLTDCFAQIVAAVRPKWFVMENVDRAQKSRAYSQARKIFVESGYGLTEKVLNACAFGVPQNRRRFFCVGRLGVKDNFLLDNVSSLESSDRVTVREYFKSVGHKLEIGHYYRHPRNYSRRGVFSIDELAPTMRGMNRPVPGGYVGHSGDTYNAKKVRPLTSYERALIQTFPPDFNIFGSKTAVELMIGNAVPVKMAKAVANTVLTCERMLAVKENRRRKAKVKGDTANGVFIPRLRQAT